MTHDDSFWWIFMDSSLPGWWLTYPSEYEFVSWDDEIPNIWKVIKFHGSSRHHFQLPSIATFDYQAVDLSKENFRKPMG